MNQTVHVGPLHSVNCLSIECVTWHKSSLIVSSRTLPFTGWLLNVTQHIEVKLMHLAAVSLHFTNYCTKLNLSDVAFKCAYSQQIFFFPLLLPSQHEITSKTMNFLVPRGNLFPSSPSSTSSSFSSSIHRSLTILCSLSNCLLLLSSSFKFTNNLRTKTGRQNYFPRAKIYSSICARSTETSQSKMKHLNCGEVFFYSFTCLYSFIVDWINALYASTNNCHSHQYTMTH